MEQFNRVYEILDILRSKCPSDKARTTENLMQCLKNELEEVKEALNSQDKENIIEELGDLLWNVLFLIHKEGADKNFTIEQVLGKVGNKMHFRHPHVFKEPREVSIEEAERIWKEQKKIEKEQNIIH